MKKNLLIILIGLLLSTNILAQTPQGISHQAVIRDAQGKLVASKTIGIQLGIIQGSADGTAIYVETHAPESNVNGLITYVIGEGAVSSGVFGEIDWSDGPYFLKTEVDPAGGTSYSIEGTTEFFSVPYTLHAKTSADAFDGNMQGNPITNLNDPSDAQDAASRAYVDLLEARILSLEEALGFHGIVVDVLNPATGKTWMDRNLGASRAATSSTDPEAYGDLYQWGRAADGHQKRNSGTTSTLSGSDTPGHGNFILVSDYPYDWRSPQNTNLWQGVSGVNNPCPPGYRLPTDAEWQAEIDSWDPKNDIGAFASPLKLPVAGYRSLSNGSLSLVGSNGYYWSSTVGGIRSRFLFFYSTGANMSNDYRAYGLSVRCLKDD